MHSRKAIGGALLLTLAGLAAAGAVLGNLGRFSPALDLFSHFAPLFGLMAALAGVHSALLGMRFQRPTLVAAALGVVASVLLVAPEYLRPTGPQAPADAADQIKVIQINALRTNGDIRRVTDWLIAQDADVIAISEARHDLRDAIIRRTGWKTAGAHGHLMIFTRERYLRMDRPRPPAGSDLTFVNATYASRSGPMEVVTVHFDWPNRPVFAAQPPALESVIGRMPRERMILAGDFNAAAWSQVIRRLDGSLGLIRRDRGVPTFPAQVFGRPWPLPFLSIDHVYAGPGWKTVRVERGPWLGSDHYPLIVTLAPVAPH